MLSYNQWKPTAGMKAQLLRQGMLYINLLSYTAGTTMVLGLNYTEPEAGALSLLRTQLVACLQTFKKDLKRHSFLFCSHSLSHMLSVC